VYKLILDSAIIYMYRNSSIHRYSGCLREIESQYLKKYGETIG